MASDMGPGTLVECIRDKWRNVIDETTPILGRVYTVRSVEPYDDLPPGLLLVEIVNPPHHYSDGFGEATFNSEYFRPLDDDRLAIFRDIAAGKQRELVG